MDDLISTREVFSAVQLARADLLDEGSDAIAYAETRDPSHLKIKAGARPLTFLVRPLSASHMRMLATQQSGEAKALLAFSLAVEEVRNLLPNEPLSVAKPSLPQQFGRRTLRVWDDGPDGELDALGVQIGWSVVYEIGEYVYNRALAGNGLSGAVRFAVPLSLLQELRAAEGRRARSIPGE